MYLSHKGTLVTTATIFGLGLFITVLVSQGLTNQVTTGSQAQTAPITTPVPGTLTPNAFTCAMCDVDANGTVNATDIALLQGKLALNPGSVYFTAYIAFCTPFAIPPTPVSACPVGTATTPVPTVGASTPAPTSSVTTNPSISPSPTGRPGASLGDCSSVQGPGIKDGVTNLLDYELLRQELTGETNPQTTFCDFNGNGGVDIIDFTD